jgi:hypothetical protein
MDEMVIKAMLKWPNVPDCSGWLGLDARGDWYMRDAAAQAAGPFSGDGATRESKGSRLQHTGLVAFIGRNYLPDEMGRWYFQNGPQRVYVELSHAPWVWRLAGRGHVLSHTGIETTVSESLVDDEGHAYLVTKLGLGLVHTQDMNILADALGDGLWPLSEVRRIDLPNRFGYVTSPASALATGQTQDEKKPA